MALAAPLTALAAPIDRVACIFDAPETGGAIAPRVIFERELAFEARLEALASGEPLLDAGGAYAERHVRGALDRHVATELLASLPVEREGRIPLDACDGEAVPLDESDLDRRLRLSRAVLLARVKGAANLAAAAEAEGIGDAEIARLVRREALAARYLDVMVTPMLAPTAAELREAHRAPNPFRNRPFEEARCELRRYLVGQRLAAALTSFLQSSRSRVHVRRPRAAP